MKKIIVVAETGSDVTPDMAEKLGIALVPMHVSFDTETMDDAAFPAEKIVEFYKETGKLPKTSGSTPEDFIRKFDEIHATYPEAQILYLAYSAITTCSYQSAVIAAEERDYVTFLDTKQVSVGQGNIVCKVAETINANPDMELSDAVELAKELIIRARMCFTPANLEFLRAGGRVSNVAYLGASILGLHPCIELLDGKLTATKKYRGKMNKVAAQLIKEYADHYKLDRKEKLWIIYTVGLSDEVKDVIQNTAAECGFEKLEWVQAAGVITTHGGPAAFGIAGFSVE